MANYNGARYVEEAASSVLSQSLGNLELLIADDGSTDDSAARIAALAARDPRVRLIRSQTNLGPAGARNLCLQAARGRWIAVVDNDDILHPERLDRLVAAAEAEKADIVADDLLIFDDTPGTAPATCLRGRSGRAAFDVDPVAYVRGNTLFGGAQALGYLKPLIRANLITAHGLRYDSTLRIGEDYDFILRLLLQGARFRVHPLLLYFYRKHALSISHRLSHATLEPLLAAHDRLAAAVRGRDARLDAAMARRRASLVLALRFEDLVLALKRRAWGEAVRLAASHPRATLMLHRPLLDRLQLLRRGVPSPVSDRRQVCVLSRQRIIGATNGSSAYLLGICTALRGSGCDVHLIWPSPTVFGRWPWLSLRPEMAVFSAISLRGGVRIGRHLVATDPRIAARAAVGLVARVLARLKLPMAQFDRRAPYAIAQDWQREDLLFVAQQVRRPTDIVVADYAFLTEGIPYTLSPRAASAVVMHDLFSSRQAQFDQLGAADTVARIDQATEMKHLGRAGIIVAIQATEAAVVRACLPNRSVVTAPMAVLPDDRPQPGTAPLVLFVGSNTAPNITGLRWFLDRAWPQVRAAVAGARLRVAGSVCKVIGAVPEGVELLGIVPDLVPEYRKAAVVISPLLAGSGLKIKLIEALGHGKAVVVTRVTLQGVEDLAGRAVEVADDAEEFAAAVVSLLRDDARRTARASAALDVARRYFSPAACYEDLLRALSSRSPIRNGSPGS